MTTPTPPRPGFGRVAGSIVGPAQRQFIQSSLTRGMSGAEALREMQALGMAPRVQAFYDVRRELQGLPARARALRNTPLDFVPSEGAFTRTPFVQRTRYRVILSHPTATPFPDGRTSLTAVVSYNAHLTHREIQTRAFAILAAAADNYQVELATTGLSYDASTLYDALE